jgi:hypothetical protein
MKPAPAIDSPSSDIRLTSSFFLLTTNMLDAELFRLINLKSLPTLEDITKLNDIQQTTEMQLKATQKLINDFDNSAMDQQKLFDIRNALKPAYFEKLAKALDKATDPETAYESKTLVAKQDSTPMFQYSLL